MTAPNTPKSNRQLSSLAKKINEKHRICCQAGESAIKAGRTSIEAAMAAGDMLIEARAICKKEKIKWLSWLKDNFKVGQSTAYGYIDLAEGRALIEEKLPSVELLTVNSAKRLLGKGKTPDKYIEATSASSGTATTRHIIEVENDFTLVRGPETEDKNEDDEDEIEFIEGEPPAKSIQIFGGPRLEAAAEAAKQDIMAHAPALERLNGRSPGEPTGQHDYRLKNAMRMFVKLLHNANLYDRCASKSLKEVQQLVEEL